MKIELLEDIYEADKDGNKRLKTTIRKSRKLYFEWTAGQVIEVSDASGQKFVERGQAKVVEQ